MKRFKVLFGILVVVLILAGCATTGNRHHENGMVKCPMCGHEFNEPNNP